MMNVLVLEGRLGRDIEMRVASGGVAYGVVSLCNSVYKGRDGGGKALYADTWIDCHFDGAYAESVQEQMVKGRFVSIKGELRSFQTEDGKSKGLPPRMYMKVDRVEFPPTGQRREENGSSAPAPAPAAAPRAAPAPLPAAVQRVPAKTTQVSAVPDEEDDFPFR